MTSVSIEPYDKLEEELMGLGLSGVDALKVIGYLMAKHLLDYEALHKLKGEMGWV